MSKRRRANLSAKLFLWFAKILVGFEINNIAAAILPVPRTRFGL
jgi:hypothetical protein